MLVVTSRWLAELDPRALWGKSLKHGKELGMTCFIVR